MAKRDSSDPRAARLSKADKARKASNGKQSKADLEKGVKKVLRGHGGTEERGSIATFFFGSK